jgi:hypothetical protein
MAKAYRIIFALTMQLEGGWTATFPLDCRGQAAPPRAKDAKDGMPHWPKKRTIDLRVGDQVFFRGAWHRIDPIRATRDGWLDEYSAEQCRDGGYIYRPRTPR